MNEKIKILWLYPDILNLHGDRGNLMALQRVAGLLDLPLEIIRVEAPDQFVPLRDADMLFLASGEVKNMAQIVSGLGQQINELSDFFDRGGYCFAIGSAGAVLARETKRLNGTSFSGLAILPMCCRERESVWGDDLWFSLNGRREMEIIGNQIQVLDIKLDNDAQALGQVIYGHGNNGGKDEGCCIGNAIFTNALGPLFVKNPRYAALILSDIARKKQLVCPQELSSSDTEFEDRSFTLIKQFIEKKMA